MSYPGAERQAPSVLSCLDRVAGSDGQNRPASCGKITLSAHPPELWSNAPEPPPLLGSTARSMGGGRLWWRGRERRKARAARAGGLSCSVVGDVGCGGWI